MELVSTCDSKKITSIFSAFNPQKANILGRIGFDGLLKLPFHQRFDDQFSLWLYKRLNFNDMTLELDGGVKLALRNVDVHLILGIPFEGELVKHDISPSEHAVSAFKNKLYVDRTEPSLNLSYLEYVMQKDYDSDCSENDINALKIAIVLYSVCYFLCPEMNHEFPTWLLMNFIEDVKPERLNWSHLVIWTLRRAAMSVQLQSNDGVDRIVLFGCTLLLQVFYLDNLNFGPISPYHIVLPRSRIYHPNIMSILIQSDSIGSTSHGQMQFGKTKVKRGYDVCYTRGWHDHLQIHTNLPRTYQHSFSECLEILTGGLQLLHQFAGHLNYCSSLALAQGSIQAHQLSLPTFAWQNYETIQHLLTQSFLYVKSFIINSYRHHIPATSDFPSDKRLLIGKEDVFHANTSSNHTQDGEGRKIVTSHSNFPISWFDLRFDHPTLSRSLKRKAYEMLVHTLLCSEHLERDWIIFNYPTPLSLPGHIVQHCLQLNGTFSITLVDAIMVLWHYLDTKVLEYFERHGQPHKRWRHFLPASFAEIVLDGELNSSVEDYQYLNSNAIRSSFLGEHINYNIADCQKIIMPVFTKESWSCYFWDFKMKQITILDPMLMGSAHVKAHAKHHHTISVLHKALFACKDHFFSGWDILDAGWDVQYKTNIDRRCKVQNSGLYSVYYARAFTGDRLAFSLKEQNEWNLSEARGEIAYQFSKCTDNKGSWPIVKI